MGSVENMRSVLVIEQKNVWNRYRAIFPSKATVLKTYVELKNIFVVKCIHLIS